MTADLDIAAAALLRRVRNSYNYGLRVRNLDSFDRKNLATLVNAGLVEIREENFMDCAFLVTK